MVETDDTAQLKALILAQQAEIAALKAVIDDLTARLAQNSTNSHQPATFLRWPGQKAYNQASPAQSSGQKSGRTARPSGQNAPLG